MAIRLFGAVSDLPHPEIDPESDEPYIQQLALKTARHVIKTKPKAVHIMGEHTFCFTLIAILQKEGIPCLCSTTRRAIVHLNESEVQRRFDFVRFRTYPILKQYGT